MIASLTIRPGMKQGAVSARLHAVHWRAGCVQPIQKYRQKKCPYRNAAGYSVDDGDCQRTKTSFKIAACLLMLGFVLGD
jgi:hypothetical protein